ncbi:hypothetical protein G4Y79_20895 [Phototrophicus methaneseepsis]|uniref:Uncharacterized protein n=1 Tax=Phototrophicus methaneseepsis TaxID=2710758 RepID=A0A7S8E864_9CHLR|nr:hypothetical protein [Phototrophicus methaneseepsis]QPC82115.1 hypothetical protein G4Y79_20895 [Phototrophicus methaneseepsis]
MSDENGQVEPAERVVKTGIEAQMEHVEFDYKQLTAREFAEIDKVKSQTGLFITSLLAHVVKICPKSWGDPADVKTWRKLPMFGVCVPLFAKFSSVIGALPDEIEGIVYNLDEVTADEYESAAAKFRSSASIHEKALGLTRVVKSCPGIDDPASLDCWLDAPFYTVFIPAHKGYGAEAMRQLTNFLKQFGS